MNTRNVARRVISNSRQQVFMLKYHEEVAVDLERPDLTDYWVVPSGELALISLDAGSFRSVLHDD